MNWMFSVEEPFLDSTFNLSFMILDFLSLCAVALKGSLRSCPSHVKPFSPFSYLVGLSQLSF